jgi:hypothetical protein
MGDSSSSDVALLGSTAAAPPPLTYHEKVCSLCGLTCSYVPALELYFVNHWMLETRVPPVLCHIAGAVVLATHALLLPLRGARLAYNAVTFALFVWSYVATILEGPGYLLFYYPAMGRIRIVSRALCLRCHSCSTCDERRPPRHFRKARRTVLRLDHFCHWTGCLIGHKNDKLFYLFNIWEVLFLLAGGPPAGRRSPNKCRWKVSR